MCMPEVYRSAARIGGAPLSLLIDDVIFEDSTGRRGVKELARCVDPQAVDCGAEETIAHACPGGTSIRTAEYISFCRASVDNRGVGGIDQQALNRLIQSHVGP